MVIDVSENSQDGGSPSSPMVDFTKWYGSPMAWSPMNGSPMVWVTNGMVSPGEEDV